MTTYVKPLLPIEESIGDGEPYAEMTRTGVTSTLLLVCVYQSYYRILHNKGTCLMNAPLQFQNAGKDPLPQKYPYLP